MSPQERYEEALREQCETCWRLIGRDILVGLCFAALAALLGQLGCLAIDLLMGGV